MRRTVDGEPYVLRSFPGSAWERTVFEAPPPAFLVSSSRQPAEPAVHWLYRKLDKYRSKIGGTQVSESQQEEME